MFVLIVAPLSSLMFLPSVVVPGLRRFLHVTHLKHSRLLCPGWTPKIASNVASLERAS